MGFRNPITTATDPTARAAAAAAQGTATTAGAAAAAAQGTANAAYNTAATKTTVYGPSTTAPTAPAGGFTTGDQWLKSLGAGQGVLLQQWTGSAWAAQQYGVGSLAAGAVVAGTVAAGAIDGTTITGTTITGATITGATITGGTVTGALLRTYATGQRVEVTSNDGIDLYTGDPSEARNNQGRVLVVTNGTGSAGSDNATMQLVPPQFGGTASANRPRIYLAGRTRDGTSDYGSVTIAAGTSALTATAARPSYTQSAGGHVFSGQPATFSGGLTQVAAGLVMVPIPTAGTPASAAVSFGKTFASPPAVTLGINSTAPGTQVTGVGVSAITTTGCTVYCTRTNTTTTGVYWIAVDQGL